MRLVLSTMPTDDADQTAWLERLLVGPDLGRLVGELTVLHGSAADDSDLGELLAGRRNAILARGLESLTPAQERALLTRPALLLDLQELVLTEGGAYWRDLLRTNDEIQAAVQRGRERLEGALRPGRLVTPSRRPRRYVQVALVCLTMAVCLLIALNLWNAGRRAGDAPAWGWAGPGGLPAATDRVAYLEALGDGGQQWFARRPDDPAELAKRIRELRQGCSTLLVADHPPLTDADRRWLKERCAKWADKFDTALADLGSGKDAAEVRAAVDATVVQLVKALRERAATTG